MENVNKTLYIPLYGKALVSRMNILLHDPKAEEIWAAEGFALKGKSRSKWLAYYMSMRAAVFDRWAEEKLEKDPAAVVLHLGCGMDSRILRVKGEYGQWFDVDFPQVIEQRKRYYQSSDRYQMISADVSTDEWLQNLPRGNAIVVMEGISMYLQEEALKKLMDNLCGHFDQVSLLMDCYTSMAAKASKVRNPINDVGVTEVYGIDDPCLPQSGGLTFMAEKSMTPEGLIAELPAAHRWIFRTLYAGNISKKLYRLYEYRKDMR